MEYKRSKNPDVCFCFSKAYIRVRGYGDEERMAYTKIPDVVKNWDEPMKSEMMAFYNERFPMMECVICGKAFRRIYNKVTCSPECSHEQQKRNMQRRDLRKVKAECVVCGKEFTKLWNQQKLTCSTECKKSFGKAHDGTIDRTKKKKHKSQLAKLEKEARAKGLTYGQLQAQKYLEETRVKIEPRKSGFVIYD